MGPLQARLRGDLSTAISRLRSGAKWLSASLLHSTSRPCRSNPKCVGGLKNIEDTGRHLVISHLQRNILLEYQFVVQCRKLVPDIHSNLKGSRVVTLTPDPAKRQA